MKKAGIVCGLVMLVGLGSCKKEEIIPAEPQNACEVEIIDVSTYDTIWANPYFMAYPDTWWEYANKNGTFTTYVSFEPFDILEVDNSADQCPKVYKNTVYLPTIGNLFIYKDSRVYNKEVDGIQQTYFEQIMDTIPGNLIVTVNHVDLMPNISSQWDILTTTIEVISKDEVVLIGNDIYQNVLHIYQEDEHVTKTGDYTNYFHRYYAPNIGLVKSEYYYENWNSLGKFHIWDYEIGPH